MTEAQARRQILDLIQGYRLTQALYCAAELKLADLLFENAKTPVQLASECQALVGPLSRLLRTLASLGVFQQLPSGAYANTPLSLCLRASDPDSQWACAILAGTERYKAFDKLLDCLRTGKTGFELAYGMPLFEFLKERPASARIFDQAMTGLHGAETAEMLEVFDFSVFQTLADIGGGNASLLLQALRKHPGLQGILFDLPHVTENAAKEIAAAGFTSRLAIHPGDFFKEIPLKADAYLMRHILHDWTDEECLKILRNLRRGFSPGAKLVVEYVIEEGNAPHPGKLLDLGMLVATGGRERTAEEFRSLFTSAGFHLEQILTVKSGISVLVAC